MVTPRAGRITSVEHARDLARAVLPRAVFDVIEGAAERESSAAANERAFAELLWRPAVGVQVDRPDTRTTLFGEPLAAPVLTAPCGLVGSLHPDAEPAVFAAAARAGLGAVLSTTATRNLEQVAADSGHPNGWFQLYFAGGRSGAEQLLERASAAGFTTLVLTLDTPVPGIRRRDARHGLSLPMQWSVPALARLAPQVLARPRWAARVATHPSMLGVGNTVHGLPDGGLGTLFEQVPTWADVAWVREHWSGPVVVKGLTDPACARRALAEGVDGIVVSNHGGRQLDGSPATVHALPEVLEAVDGQVPVLLDGGIRSGADVARALALGAAAVMVGRPYLYGMAVAGGAGVQRVLEILCTELETTMRLLGVATVADLARVEISAPSRVAA